MNRDDVVSDRLENHEGEAKVKFASYVLGIICVVGSVLTPVSCQYVERNGPEWVVEIEGHPESDCGVQAAFGILTLALIVGAVVCFVAPNTTNNGQEL